MEPRRSRSAEEIAAARWLLLAEDAQPELNRIARLAARLLGSASAQVSLLTDVQTVAGGTGLPAEMIGSQTPLAESLCTVTATCGEPLIVPDARADDRVVDLPPVLSGAVGSYLGVPLVNDENRTVGALCVFDPDPHDWSAADVTLLEQLAYSAAAELELAALSGEIENSRVRWELAITAAGIGGFDWDVVRGHFGGDERMLAMLGFTADSFDETLDALRSRIHPDDLPGVDRAIRDAIERVGVFDAEFRVLLPSGTVGWVQARGQAIAEEAGRTLRLIGAAFDTTARREAETGVVRVLESMSSAFVALDHSWRLTYVNTEAERVLGMDRAVLVGGQLWELFPALRGSEFEPVYRAAMAGQPGVIEAFYPAPRGGWFEVRASPAPGGLSLYFLDVTTRRTAQDLARLSARIGEQLSDALDIRTAARALAVGVVPELADWSMVSVVQQDGIQQDLAHWHRDPTMRPVLDQYAKVRVEAVRGRGVVADALRLTAPVILSEGVTQRAVHMMDSPAAVDAITQLAPESAVVLPLTARGHLIGALSLCRGADRVPMSEQELQIAIGIAARAGLALDNIGLYAEQHATAQRLDKANQQLLAIAAHDRTVARALQDAMLTRLPEQDHLRLVARYLTATRTELVGGDWYDAVVLPTGATILMIGDVAGHDIRAAALMGQLRNMLRALAWDRSDEPPSAVVTRLDQAMRDLHLTTFATLTMVRIEQSAADHANNRRTLRWTNAGHPPPVLVHADGTATFLATDNDILLGAAPHATRHDHTQLAPPGSTLILYTDGLIETRTADLDHGQERLLDSLRAHHQLAPDALLDAVLDDMIGPQPDDDVAILAVRFNPQGRPRPAEAGPQHT